MLKWFNENVLDLKMIVGHVVSFLALWGPEIGAIIVGILIIRQVIKVYVYI